MGGGGGGGKGNEKNGLLVSTDWSSSLNISAKLVSVGGSIVMVKHCRGMNEILCNTSYSLTSNQIHWIFSATISVQEQVLVSQACKTAIFFVLHAHVKRE